METIRQELLELKQLIDQHIEDCWDSTDWPSHLQQLSESIVPIANKISSICNHSFEQLQQLEVSDANIGKIFPHFLINFRWAEQGKHFLTFWRNVQFEEQRAYLMWLDKKANLTDIEGLKQRSKTAAREAAEYLIDRFDQIVQEIRSNRGGSRSQINKWNLQENPWPVYQLQIGKISEQSSTLFTQFEKLVSLSAQFQQISEILERSAENCEQQFEQIRNSANSAGTIIDEHIDERIGKIPVLLEEMEKNIELVNHRQVYLDQLDQIIDQMEERTQVIVDTQHGMMQTLDVNFKKEVRQWLDSEVLPVLFEEWELTEQAVQSIKMSLLNIRNRALLMAQEEKEPDIEKDDLKQPIEAFEKKSAQLEENLINLKSLVRNRLDKQFLLSEVFEPSRSFLPVPLQSAINQFRFTDNPWLVNVKQWGETQLKKIERFRTSVETEESLSLSEKIVRFVQSRTVDASNSHYNSIFLTSGFVGESFWVGRAGHLNHMELLISQWQLGFRGSVILSGNRLSGKSLFGEMVAQKYFPGDTIRLRPESTINMKGRRMETTYDLGEALEFVRKYNISGRPMIWIDDLELWNSPEMPLSRNVRLLSQFIDSHSSQLFFLVSMSNWVRSHLQQILQIDRVFQTAIKLDHMDLEEIQQAILIRHGATHKTLVNEEGEEVSPQQFRSMTKKIYKVTEGNIGEALNRWALSTKRAGEEEVIHDYHYAFLLPDFIQPDVGILLSSLMMSKRTNEYRLRKRFGPPFKNRYKDLLQRLIGVGLLKRHLDGWLEINELAANELGRLLDQKNYLEFQSGPS